MFWRKKLKSYQQKVKLKIELSKRKFVLIIRLEKHK